MKQLSRVLSLLTWALFVLFLLLPNSSVEAFVEVNPITPTEIVSKSTDQKQIKKQQLKQLRLKTKKWVNNNRNSLTLGAGLLGLFSLIGWRKKLRRLKMKAKLLNDFGEGGCFQMFLMLLAVALISMGTSWALEALFGLVVGFWMGALIGLLVIGLIVYLIWLISN